MKTNKKAIDALNAENGQLMVFKQVLSYLIFQNLKWFAFRINNLETK